MKKDIVIIGGGPAGLACACACYDKGVKDILIIERDEQPGGILQQCIHPGFGLKKFKQELTGGEYAQIYIDAVEQRGISILTMCSVLEITPDKKVYCVSPTQGILEIEAEAIVLAMGCRERTRGHIKIPGSRPPKGVYTAGLAQKMVNIKGILPGKRTVILGSGDIGLIMARRMLWEGSEVVCVCEIAPYSAGLARNVQQCLKDYNIPLHLSTTVTKIHGDKVLEGVTIAGVDDKFKPIPGTEEYIPCDTLLLSVGLIPENELSRKAEVEIDPVTSGPVVDQNRQTSIPGIYACGNVLHVHDIVDFVSEESEIAGIAAAERVLGKLSTENKRIKFVTGNNIRYTVPQQISLPEDKSIKVFLRVAVPTKEGYIKITSGDTEILRKNIIKALPSEMIQINLSPDNLSKIESTGNDQLHIQWVDK